MVRTVDAGLGGSGETYYTTTEDGDRVAVTGATATEEQTDALFAGLVGNEGDSEPSSSSDDAEESDSSRGLLLAGAAVVGGALLAGGSDG